jgi:thioredoxin reductase (NADPH)
MVHKVAIIGSGPAGLTAAIYAARANLEPVVIEGMAAGGQLMLTTEVENYPGFPKGLMGPDMMALFKEQAVRFGAQMVAGDVEKVDFSKRPFTLWVDDKAIEADAVIVATGASAMWLGIPSETKLRGHGVSACATCDGFFFKDKPVAVVGGGDTAMEESNFLTKFASNVVVVHRRDKLRASKIMQERAQNNPKISFKWNSVVTEVLGEGSVQGLRLKDTRTGAEETMAVQGLFLAIGHKPNTEFLRGALDMDDQGYIKIHDNTRSSVEGVFVAGDVFDRRYRQAITAAGSGCQAAIDAERWLEEKGHGL